MITVDTIGRVRRAYFVQGRKIKAIARELKLARNTVRDIVRAGEGQEATERRYVRKDQPLPRLGPYVGQLEAMLAANAQRPRRERLTFQRMFEELRLLGYGGGYDNVRRHARRWTSAQGAATAEAYVPLSFAPGEAYQFDWSHEHVLIAGPVTVRVAQVRLCHSRMLYVRAYLRETQEMVFDAHEKAFAFFKGTPLRGIYDNMKTAVETVFLGKDRQYNRRFLQLMSHHLIEPTACTPAAGWEKGQVENQVGVVRGRFFAPKPSFKTLADLNAWLADKHRLCARAGTPGRDRQDRHGGVRGRAQRADGLPRSLRRLPCGERCGIEDLPRALRQRQVLGRGQGGWSRCSVPC